MGQSSAEEDEWVRYVPGDPESYVPIAQWGRDHWSTLAYIETRAVDHGGVLKNEHMRCNSRLHRGFAHHVEGMGDGAAYPTRLRDGRPQENHDDWSCLEDMAAAGLVEVYFRRQYPGLAFGNMQAKVVMTAVGMEWAAELRQHKASGGKFDGFMPTSVRMAAYI